MLAPTRRGGRRVAPPQSRVGARAEVRLAVKSRIVEVIRSVRRCDCTMARIVIMEQNLKVNSSLANLSGEIVGDRAQRVNVFNLNNLSLVSNSCRCHGVRLHCIISIISNRSAGYEGIGGWGLSVIFLDHFLWYNGFLFCVRSIAV